MSAAIHFLKRQTLGLRRDLFIAFFAICITLALIPLITYGYFASDLTSKEKIMNRNNQGVVLTDRDDRPFFTFYQGTIREEVPISVIPKLTQEAFIAMEDKDFYSHPGFSLKSITRSMFKDLAGQDLSYGGSTITQQLVKNSLLTSRKDFLRKYQEIVLASEIERRYKKDEILEMYLNSVYLGEGAFGIEEAAATYFNKDAKDMDLAQSALLAAILPAPSKFALISGDLEAAKKRQKIVLQKMMEQKYITDAERQKAESEEVKITSTPSNLNIDAPHFALMVKDQLIQKYGEEVVARSGFRVKTTLNLDWQEYAQKVVADQVEKLKVNNASNGAAIVLDPRNGEIRALVGSKDWYDDKFGKVNIALSKRPPGSSFKPIVYIAGFEERKITPATQLHDQPTNFANFDQAKFYASFPTKASAEENLKNDPNAFYKPQNYDRKFRGLVTVRRALSNSLNVPAVEVMAKVGLPNALEMAKRLGISTLEDESNYGLSLVLGTAEVEPLEMTNVYATFANKGYMNTPTSILEIKDKKGNILYKYQPDPKKVLDEKDTFLISSILSDNNTRSEVFGSALNLSRLAAVKTGTTEDYKDAWTIGYTPSLAIGVWVGNNFGQPMDGVAGSLGAAPIWKSLMEQFLKDSPVEKFEQPTGVIKLSVCEGTASARIEYFEVGTQPKDCQKQSTPSAQPIIQQNKKKD